MRHLLAPPRGAALALALGTLILLPGLLRPLPAGALQDPEEAGRQVDELFRPWHRPDSPGAAVLVMHGGRVVHSAGYGMASLEHGVPIRPYTVFDIASVSKQFGAMAIALLESDGLISLDDDVRRYIPELPDFGPTIRIRHLVHHTSGIRDWPQTLGMAGWDYQDVISFEQILRMAFHQEDLNFPPGDDYAYSNTGYNLLAEVVARVTGRSFREWTEERIFRPLGMRHTHFHDAHDEVVANRAESYRPRGGGQEGHLRVVNSLTALASSSLFTTIEDLALWVANFRDPVVGGPEVVGRLHERGILNGGDTLDYAFGQVRGEYRGVRRWSHGGSWAGYRTVLQRFPDEDFAVVILANTAGMNPGAMADRIADLYLADRLAPAVPSAPAPGGGGGRDAGAEPWRPTPSDLQAYAGPYESPELLSRWTVAVEGERLVARHFRLGDRTLTPVRADVFQAPGMGEVVFHRDGAGRITHFTANSVRVRNLRFHRLEG